MKQEIEGEKYRKKLFKFTNSCAQYGSKTGLFGALEALFFEKISSSYHLSE
ncbi:hypothetical protein [Bacteroides reticulotermitis]|uniref:Uncharacterized protein n=1 Tax=Bacteroides reticulotermitis JCM 10512 TaxID=1445607 RepID=W4UPX5_9BACE|nr:hypothetical protein [Bacteroides reticulotermitis]GAE82991.1 hypothetical protein JCM10512_1235 [Bacteroides reticulotermitis JCM 10512]